MFLASHSNSILDNDKKVAKKCLHGIRVVRNTGHVQVPSGTTILHILSSFVAISSTPLSTPVNLNGG